jgi:xylan 1,4-beta-xylosidase
MNDAPYFIRAHFLLCSGDGTGRPKWGSSNVYTEDVDSNPVYSWDILDRIFDTYLETNCVPFVELGFMPEALTTAPPDVVYDDPRNGGWRYPPKSYERWQGLMQALTEHFLERYGLREVSKWYWELWNEPDIFYWKGSVEEYCRLYDHTVAGIEAVLPNTRIGGPGTTNPSSTRAGDFLQAFLEHCLHGTNTVTGKQGTRLDFISFHSKGAGGEVFSPDKKATPTISALLRHVQRGLEIASGFPELAGREVILTECDPDGWAAGSKHNSPNLQYRNSEYYASYVACAACKLLDMGKDTSLQVDGMLTWAFQFENREYFEGLRTLSTNGIDKPVLNVFRLLAKLGGMRLQLTSAASDSSDTDQVLPDISGVASMNGSDEIQILLCSHHDDWDIHGLTQVKVEVVGLNPDYGYRLRRLLIDSVHSNSYSAWVEMGEPQNPSEEQLRILKRASMLKTVEETTVTNTDGKCAFTVPLAAHSVCLVELIPVEM